MTIRFNNFFETALKLQRENPDLRTGQAMMNVLHDWEPGIADHIMSASGDLDPFYVSDNMGRFLDYVKATMPEYPSACSHSNSIINKCPSCPILHENN